MTWILPAVTLPAGGKLRSVGRFDSRAYHRAYYHAKRKPRKQTYTPVQSEQRNAQRREAYQGKLEKMRADARARYWKHRDRYAAAARERARAKRAK